MPLEPLDTETLVEWTQLVHLGKHHKQMEGVPVVSDTEYFTFPDELLDPKLTDVTFDFTQAALHLVKWQQLIFLP